MTSSASFAAVKSVRIDLPGDAGPVVKNIAALFARQIRQRCNAKAGADRDAGLTVEFRMAPRGVLAPPGAKP
ncbi:MAG: hypothetical protein HY343_09355 [Lentisphaerae bacterium]|nr:hypothetical protein [Lentisphaerota bacterium]